MKILVTQRQIFDEARGEHIDLHSSVWCSFVESLGFLMVPVPNQSSNPSKYIDDDTVGLILSGGGDVDKDQPDRDRTERILLAEAKRKGVPAIGICRGAQLIAIDSGWKLVKIEDHIRKRHALHWSKYLKNRSRPAFITNLSLLETDFNSYHNYGIVEGKHDLLIPLLVDSDGYVEMFADQNEAVLGIMWHPERETPFRKFDIELIQTFLRKKNS